MKRKRTADDRRKELELDWISREFARFGSILEVSDEEAERRRQVMRLGRWGLCDVVDDLDGGGIAKLRFNFDVRNSSLDLDGVWIMGDRYCLVLPPQTSAWELIEHLRDFYLRQGNTGFWILMRLNTGIELRLARLDREHNSYYFGTHLPFKGDHLYELSVHARPPTQHDL